MSVDRRLSPRALQTAPAAPAVEANTFAKPSLSELTMPVAVLAIIIALIVPVPDFALDFLIVIDIMLSLIVMMVAMYIRRPVEFSVFPTTLLLMTLFRLALNVSSSRLILLNGNTGTAAAGHVIEAFGSFMVGGNYIIGAVIFLLLIAIQYVVINHGAVRISEVTARFTLDALPGKQMAIDADLNAGLIDEAEARNRRHSLAREAEFYGAMDGASRFTQRDAVASILITAINIIAGFFIGVFQHGMDLRRALETYTVLTIGDGLVTVIPALMISVSGGLIVTRASSDVRLGVDLNKQLFGASQPLLLAAGVTIVLAVLPGLPTMPFLVLGLGLGSAAWRMRRKLDAPGEVPTPRALEPAAETIETLLHVEPVTIEVGLGLVNLVERGAHSPLLQRISAIRRQLASQLGFVLPSIKVSDNLTLRSREYVVLLKGAEIARYELLQGHELAIPAGSASSSLPDSRPAREPAFGLPACWIKSTAADAARAAGFTVVDTVSVMGTHIAELVRSYAHELFTRKDAKQFCDRAARDDPKAVEDVVPKLLSLTSIQRVLQNLLRERVSIRDAAGILEALAEAGAVTKNPILLTEYVRQSIRRIVVKPFVDRNRELMAYLVDPRIGQAIESAVEHGEHNSAFSLSPQMIRDLIDRFRRQLDRPEMTTVAITSSGARYFLRQIVESSMPHLTVLSHNEIPPEVTVRALKTLE
jgi:flagellar biosynthesis protein FlhA